MGQGTNDRRCVGETTRPARQKPQKNGNEGTEDNATTRDSFTLRVALRRAAGYCRIEPT